MEGMKVYELHCILTTPAILKKSNFTATFWEFSGVRSAVTCKFHLYILLRNSYFSWLLSFDVALQYKCKESSLSKLPD